MKKALFLSMAILLIFGCQKQQNSKTQTVIKPLNENLVLNKPLLDNIKAYSVNFKAAHPQRNYLQGQNQRGWLKRLLKIIGADILGAIGGAIVGAGVSDGNPVITAGAAIVSAMGASFEAGDSRLAPYTPTNTNSVDGLPFRYNLSNPYDFVGNKHNEGLDKLEEEEFQKGLGLTTVEVYLSAKNFTYLGVNGISDPNFITQEQYDILVTNNQVLQYLKAEEDLSVDDIPTLNEKINSLNYLNITQKEVLSSIFSFGVELDDEATLPEYFKGIEDIIMVSNLDEKEKKVYLSGFAVGRASANFWYDVENGDR